MSKSSLRLTLMLMAILVTLLLLTACAAGSRTLATPTYWPTQGWQYSTPEEQGFDSGALADGLQAMRDNKINIHSLMLIRNDHVILDAYFYPYDGETVHELASVTKSFLTTLIGMAIDQEVLKRNDRMVSFFPDRTIANLDSRKNRIMVEHLAGMTSGLDCTAENDEQTLHEMELYEDWIQFILDREMAERPGKTFVYCSPGMHVLSAILQEATGMTAMDFAQANLFEPLGIHDVMWDVDPQGYSDGWAGLYLHPHDAAKLGLLYLYGGQWEGQQLVSRRWIEDSVKRQVTTGMGDDYGYGWWVMPGDQGEYAAEGRSGQYIRVFPALNAVVVTTGGGFEWNDIAPTIGAAVVDTTNPLPADPESQARLAEMVDAVRRAPEPLPVAPLPATAEAVSGKSYTFEPNPMNLETLRLNFSDAAEAQLQATFTDQPPQDLTVGLDGIYRLHPVDDYGLSMGLRGTWIDDNTFQLEYDRIANRDAYTLRFTFTGDRLAVELQERTREAPVAFEGQMQEA